MIMQVLVLEDDIERSTAQTAISRFLAWSPKPPGDIEHQVVYVTAATDFRWNVASSYQHKCETLQRALELASCFKITQAEVYGVQGDNFEHLYTVTVHPRA